MYIKRVLFRFATVMLACVFLMSATARPAGAQENDIVATADSAGIFTVMLDALEAAGLADTLRSPGPFTVFALTDSLAAMTPEEILEQLLDPANQAQLRQILTYHIVPGEYTSAELAEVETLPTLNGQPLTVTVSNDTLMINNAIVVMSDLLASNGVIHAISQLLVPAGDVVDVIEYSGVFSTLLAALEAADLTDALRGEGPFTVFAPTDSAFGKLPQGTLEELLEPGNQQQLQQVLTYHVVPGNLSFDEIAGMETLTALNGETLNVTVSGDTVMINDSAVVFRDLAAGNGVVHTIDQVLVPDTVTSVEEDAPAPFRVSAPYPNPFNPSVTIGYVLPEALHVSVVIYDVLGRRVCVLQDGLMSPGGHEVVWNARDSQGNQIGSGAYLYRIRAGSYSARGKIMLLR